jgi:hypothetical protein
LEIKIYREKLKGGIDSMLRSFILFAGLVLALGLAGCPQQAEEPAAEDTEMVEVEEEVVIEEAPDEMPADSDDADSDGMTDDSGEYDSK